MNHCLLLFALALDCGAGGDESTSGVAHNQNPTQDPPSATTGMESAPFKSALDLKRFQKLIQEQRASATQSIPRQVTETAAQKREGEAADKQNPSELSDSVSVTDVSELSSIPVHPDLAMQRGPEGNMTIDSEVSSVYNAARHTHSQPAQDTVLSQQEGVVNQQPPLQPAGSRQSIASHQGGVVNQLPSQQRTVSGHPLHFSHKMAHQKKPHPHGGRGTKAALEALPCSEKTGKIHADLAALEKVTMSCTKDT